MPSYCIEVKTKHAGLKRDIQQSLINIDNDCDDSVLDFSIYCSMLSFHEHVRRVTREYARWYIRNRTATNPTVRFVIYEFSSNMLFCPICGEDFDITYD